MAALRVAGLLALLAAVGANYDCVCNICLRADEAGSGVECIVNRTCDNSSECADSDGQCVTKYSNATRDAVTFECAVQARNLLAANKDAVLSYLDEDILGPEEAADMADMLDLLLSEAFDFPDFPDSFSAGTTVAA